MNEAIFWQVFAAVLGANLLTVGFVWGIVNYAKHERGGSAGTSPTHKYALALLAPLAFVTMGLMIALDRVPAWLDAILR